MVDGRIIPQLPICDLTPAEGLKRYRESLGQALTAAQDAINNARAAVATGTAALQTAIDNVDDIIALNPDPTTPNSTEELLDSIGGQTETRDREILERRVAALLDLNVVNGVLFPPGLTDLVGLRLLFQSLELSGDCTLPDLSGGFVFVSTVDCLHQNFHSTPHLIA